MKIRSTTNTLRHAGIVTAMILSMLPARAAAPSGQLYWDPNATGSLNAGGGGLWDNSTQNWRINTTTPYTWGVTTTGTFSRITFGGTGQGAAPYTVNISLDSILAPSIGSAAADLYAFTLTFGGNYTLRSIAPGGTTLGGNGVYVYFDVMVDSGRQVFFDGSRSRITLVSDGNNSTTPSLRFAGGGTVLLGENVTVNQMNQNGRITVGITSNAASTTVIADAASTHVRGARLFVDNGSFIVNNGATAEFITPRSRAGTGRSAIQIGNVSGSVTSSITLNDGKITAIPNDNNDNEINYGILFGNITASTGNAGGIFNLNGGLLVTTDIVATNTTGATTAQFVFNGGTLAVSNEAHQRQLDRFMSGFDGSPNKFIHIGEGGAVIDTGMLNTGSISTDGVATISSAMIGEGGLTKTGSNTLSLAVASAYQGATVVAGGALKLDVADAIAQSAAVTIAGGAALDSTNLGQTFRNLGGAGSLAMGSGNLIVDSDAATIFSGIINGTGSLEKTGTGSLALTAAKGYTGPITITAGTLRGNTASLAGNIANAGAIVFDQNTDGIYADVISGAGALGKEGDGTLTLGRASEHTGATTIYGGTLKAGVADVIAQSGALTIAAGATFDADGKNQSVKNLAGDGNIALGAGRLTVVNTVDTVFGGIISGAGALEKNGAGILGMTGDNSSYTGAVAVNAGSLLLGGANARLGGAVTVAAGAVFGGVGQAGAVTIASGGELYVGLPGVEESSLLDIATLSLGANAQLDFGIYKGDSANAANSVNSRLTAASLNLNGAASSAFTINLNQAVIGKFNLGNIAALNGANVLVDNESLAGTRLLASLGASAGDLILDIVVNGGNKAITWTGANTNIWNIKAANWQESSATITFAPGDKVIFDSVSDGANTAARDIGITGSNVIVSDIEVSGAGSYRLSGASIIIDAASASGLAATGLLKKTGDGTLTLANAGTNIFSGGVVLSGGTLALETDGALGASNLTVDGASASVLVSAAALIASGTFTLLQDATIDTLAGATASLTGRVTGAGKLIKTGDGVLELFGDNAHAGTELAAGTLVLGHANALGSAGSVLSVTGGGATVQLAAALTLANNIDAGAHGVAIDTKENAVTLSGAVSGSGDTAKAGTGVLTLAGANTYSGALTINEGAVAVDSLARLGAATSGVAIADVGALRVSAGGDLAFDRALSGRGRLEVSLGGTADTFSLAAGAGTAFEGVVALKNASFTIDSAASASLAGATLELGEGSFSGKAAGAQSLGGLAFAGGMMKFDLADTNLLAVGTLDAGTVESRIMVDTTGLVTPGNNPAPSPDHIFDQDGGSKDVKLIAATHVVGGAGNFRLVNPDGTPAVTTATVDLNQGADGKVADATYGYVASAKDDGLWLGVGLTKLSILAGKTLILDNRQASDSTLSTDLTGEGGVHITAVGAVTLSGSNSYSGATHIASGWVMAGRENIFGNSSSVTLDAGAGLDIGDHDQMVKNLSGAGSIVLGNATLTVNAETNAEYSGAISGAGGIAKTGAGTLTLSGTSTHIGGNSFTQGRVVIKNTGALGAGVTTLAPGGVVLEFNDVRGAFTRAINGGGAVEVVNSGVSFSNSGNEFSSLTVRNSTVTAATSNGLGGAGSNITIDSASALRLGLANPTGLVAAHNVTINGGLLEIGAAGHANRLDLGTGTLTFNSGSIALVARIANTGEAVPVLKSGSVAGDIPAFVSTEHYSEGIITVSNGNMFVVPVSSDFDPNRQVSLTFDAMLASMSAVHSRVNEGFLLPVLEKNPKRNGLWMKGLASFAKYDADDAKPGHTEDTYGLIIGCDSLTPRRNYLLGAYAGLASSRMDTDFHSNTDMDHQFVGLYGSGQWGALYASLNAMAGWSSADNTRVEASGNAASRTDANYYGGTAEIGLVFKATGNLRVQPLVAIEYLRADFDGHRERGAGAVRVPSYSGEAWQSLAAVRLSQKFNMPWGWASALDLSLGWRQALTDNEDQIDVSFIDTPVLGTRVAIMGYERSSAVAGFGLRSMVSEKTALGVGYDFEIASDRSRHSLFATIRWVW